MHLSIKAVKVDSTNPAASRRKPGVKSARPRTESPAIMSFRCQQRRSGHHLHANAKQNANSFEYLHPDFDDNVLVFFVRFPLQKSSPEERLKTFAAKHIHISESVWSRTLRDGRELNANAICLDTFCEALEVFHSPSASARPLIFPPCTGRLVAQRKRSLRFCGSGRPHQYHRRQAA